MNLRRPTPADLPAVVALLRAVEEHHTGEPEWTEAELRREWDDLDLEHDVWLVEVDGTLAACGMVETRRGDPFFADGYVHPDCERRGIGSELLRVMEDRARELGGRRLQNATFAGDPCVDALYERRGYAPIRHFWRMVADLADQPAVASPAGIEIRRYRHPEEARTVHAVLEESFEDHWNHRPREFEDWSRRVFALPDFDPGLCWVAYERGEMVGAAVCNWKRFGDWGWIASLGVRRRWRRRGIAEALLKSSFGEFLRRGERRVALGVDAQSETGATRLYEKDLELVSQ